MSFYFDQAKCLGFLASADSVVQSLFKSSASGTDNFEVIADNLKTMLKPRLGNVEVYFYGSRVIGVGDKSSDLDIFIDIGGKYYSGYEFTKKDDENYHAIKLELEKSPKWTNPNAIRRTFVPILQATFSELGLNCKYLKQDIPNRLSINSFTTLGDISISNGVSHANSLILRHLFEIQPEAAKLVHFVKKMIGSQNFDGLTRYSVVVLVLFFLQQRNLMPSIKVVHRGVEIKRAAGKCSRFHCRLDSIELSMYL